MKFVTMGACRSCAWPDDMFCRFAEIGNGDGLGAEKGKKEKGTFINVMSSHEIRPKIDVAQRCAGCANTNPTRKRGKNPAYPRWRVRFVWITIVLCLLLGSVGAIEKPTEQPPKAADARLVVELFAVSPDIVHPIGIDFDQKGRLLVIESHTHFRPKDYNGPPHDRIRVLEDTDGDGKADRFSTFFEGTKSTMDISVHRDGSVYIATRNEILRLRDADGDGKAESKERLMFLDTEGAYPHNGLSGLCFDSQGNLYFGMGENLGAAYKLMGSDGGALTGEGEGGNIFWCTADGKKLRRVATGFWNPFGICRDSLGRIFAVDNDPDAMPPCRMLHVVDGGDYGYQFRYGRSGRHVFQGWNGEFPGTLPQVTGTGEAPCEIISYESNGLPEEYLGNLLVAAWGDHRVERYVPRKKGVSYTAERKPFIQGGKDFHPVGIAIDLDGSLFISDWALKDYNLHGKGAIWGVRWKDRPKKQPGNPRKPVSKSAAALREADESLASFPDAATWLELRNLLVNDDPFVRHAAVMQLAKRPKMLATANLYVPLEKRVSIGLLLANRTAANPEKLALTRFLADSDEEVRLLAVKWVADEKLAHFRPLIAKALEDHQLNVLMFSAYSTALARIDGREVNEGRMVDHFFDRLADDKTPAAARAKALQVVPTTYKKLTVEFLARLIGRPEPDLQREALRALSEHPDMHRLPILLETAGNPAHSDSLRAQALVGLADQAEQRREDLLHMALGDSSILRDDALRCLKGVKLTPAQAQELNKLAERHTACAALVARVLEKPFTKDRPRPADLDAWLKRLDGPADVDAGRRVFAHAKIAGCNRCHRVEGRGHETGPDLSMIGRTSRRHILESILQPSNLVAPHYLTWAIETSDGRIRQGMLMRTLYDDYTYLDPKGEKFKVSSRDVVESRPVSTSLMPDGLADLLTDQEIRDLLAYLCSLN